MARWPATGTGCHKVADASWRDRSVAVAGASPAQPGTACRTKNRPGTLLTWPHDVERSDRGCAATNGSRPATWRPSPVKCLAAWSVPGCSRRGTATRSSPWARRRSSRPICATVRPSRSARWPRCGSWRAAGCRSRGCWDMVPRALLRRAGQELDQLESAICAADGMRPLLVHGDYGTSNVALARATDGHWQVVAVFDFESAAPRDPVEDFVWTAVQDLLDEPLCLCKPWPVGPPGPARALPGRAGLGLAGRPAMVCTGTAAHRAGPGRRPHAPARLKTGLAGRGSVDDTYQAVAERCGRAVISQRAEPARRDRAGGLRGLLRLGGDPDSGRRLQPGPPQRRARAPADAGVSAVRSGGGDRRAADPHLLPGGPGRGPAGRETPNPSAPASPAESVRCS